MVERIADRAQEVVDNYCRELERQELSEIVEDKAEKMYRTAKTAIVCGCFQCGKIADKAEREFIEAEHKKWMSQPGPRWISPKLLQKR